MNIYEKLFSIFAVLFAVVFFAALLKTTLFDQLPALIIGLSIGLLINILYMFILFKDLYYRKFDSPAKKAVWFVCILLFWPSSMLYLVLHGFHKR